MWYLIFSICIVSPAGADVCQENIVSAHKTTQACMAAMEPKLKALAKKDNPVYPFDWEFVCTREK